uniref:Uncharacterized protein n=1 Tax=Spongospora subterranea TaxID=70186 RepID=A0A0H5QV43_9EUKA|eukprot:CRZ05456.1 hypothetical protein [Spongospora subterranea]
MLLFAMIQGSTGSATQCISTENCVVSLQLVRNTEDSEEEDISTTRLAPQEGRPGKGIRLCLSAATVDLLDLFERLSLALFFALSGFSPFILKHSAVYNFEKLVLY